MVFRVALMYLQKVDWKMAILWCTLHMCASLYWTENSFLTNCYQFHKWIYIPPKNIFLHNTELETLFIIDQGCWKGEGGGLEKQAPPSTFRPWNIPVDHLSMKSSSQVPEDNAKGQLISKAIYVVLDSSKKTNEKDLTWCIIVVSSHFISFFCSFFWRS